MICKLVVRFLGVRNRRGEEGEVYQLSFVYSSFILRYSFVQGRGWSRGGCVFVLGRMEG